MRKAKALGYGLLVVGISWLFFIALPAAGAAHTHLLAVMRRMTTAHALSNASRTYTVRATAYEAIANQTDSKPFITADNSRIPRGYGSHTRWLALSRDLLRPWGGPFEFGDKVRVRGISPALDGVYTVHDTMNRRYRHCLDVLVHPREHVSLSRSGVKIRRVSVPQHRGSVSHLVVAHKASTRPKRAPRRASAQPALAHHRAEPHRQDRAQRVAAARPTTRRSKQVSQPKRQALLAHQKHGVAKQQLAALPKRPKKRIVAQVHHLPAA